MIEFTRSVAKWTVVLSIGLATGWVLEMYGYEYTVFRAGMWVFFHVGV